MSLPVRCYTCNATIADRYGDYRTRVHSGETAKVALDELAYTRLCCRRMVLSHADALAKDQSTYPYADITLTNTIVLRRECVDVHTVSCD